MSATGRVRSWRKRGGGRLKVPLLRRTGETSDGYTTIMLSVSGEKRTFLVHRLVLLAWVGPPRRGQVAAHLDGDKTNNTVGNLAWVTRAENEGHKRAHGTDPRGERNGSARLTEGDVRAIRRRHRAGGVSFEALGREYGVSGRQVAYIVRREKWAHVA